MMARVAGFVSVVIVALAARADTVFLGTVDTDFNNPANWSAGLPDAATGPGFVNAPATLSADYLMLNNGSPSVTDIYVESTLNTGAFELQLRSGTVPQTSDIFVGSIGAGVLYVDAGGLIDIAGAAADLFIGNATVAGSSVVVRDGGTLAASKSVEILNGILVLEDGATWSTAADELVVSDAGVLAFEIDAVNGIFAAQAGSSLQVQLAPTSELSLSFTTAPTPGQSFDLLTGVSGFTEVGGTGTGMFGTVEATGLGAGQSVDLVYDAAAGTLRATVIPEPASLLLFAGGLAVAGLARRRR